MNEAAISTKKLCKTFRTGLLLKRFVALDNLDLEVKQGEILGYLGPNGSGKTTTFKLLLGLMRPDSGSVTFFGNNNSQQDFRGDIGFLPENPYFYAYLTAAESLNFHGRLYGMKKEERRQRIDMLLTQVGLDHARDRQLRKFSRGMLQRIGIAQALVNDPKLLILDEPMSGLDPMGRKQMRDIILTCRDQGKTVIFSSHILSDVEMMCDRAAIILQGKLQEVVSVHEILEREIKYWEITCANLPQNVAADIAGQCLSSIKSGGQWLLKIQDEPQAVQIIKHIEEAGGRLVSFGPQRESLEDVFIRQAAEGTGQ